MSAVKTGLKFALILGGIGLAFKDQIAAAISSAPAPVTDAEGSQAQAPAGPRNSQAPTVATIDEAALKQATMYDDKAAALGTAVLLTIHEWNWYREAIAGVNPGTDFAEYGQNPNERISATQYRGLVKQHGLSGLGLNVRRLH